MRRAPPARRRLLVGCAIASAFLLLISISSQAGDTGSSAGVKFLLASPMLSKPKDCSVNPKVLAPSDYDAPQPKQLPQGVKDFSEFDEILPKVDPSELILVSMTSNLTYDRVLAQQATFGRIIELKVVSDTDWEHCILCDKSHFNPQCHCPELRKGCDVFWDKGEGWWCGNKKNTRALQKVLHELGEENLPKWIHMIDDDTWVNPITELMLINILDHEEEWYLGDDWGAFAGGGSGHLISRAALRKLLGPPVVPNPVFQWTNGTWEKSTNTQIDSCYEKVQGGEWCYLHSDWAIAACLYDLGIHLTNLGGGKHNSIFSQFHRYEAKKLDWFSIKNPLNLPIHNALAVAYHSNVKLILETFEKDILPFYQKMRPSGMQNQAKEKEHNNEAR